MSCGKDVGGSSAIVDGTLGLNATVIARSPRGIRWRRDDCRLDGCRCTTKAFPRLRTRAEPSARHGYWRWRRCCCCKPWRWLARSGFACLGVVIAPPGGTSSPSSGSACSIESQACERSRGRCFDRQGGSRGFRPYPRKNHLPAGALFAVWSD